jgi:hypothetical protein
MGNVNLKYIVKFVLHVTNGLLSLHGNVRFRYNSKIKLLIDVKDSNRIVKLS